MLEASRARAGSEPALRLLVGGSLVIVGGLAWAWTVAMAAMPDCHRVALGDLLVMWTVMMAAMMFPAPIPAVLAYAGFARARGEHMLLATLAIVGGCLVVWGALGIPAHALLPGGERAIAGVPALARAGGAILNFPEKVLRGGGALGRLAGVALCVAGTIRLLS